MNIVQAEHLNNYMGKRYIYRLYSGIEIKKGDLLLVENQLAGTPDVVKATGNSENVNENVLNMIMQGQEVRSRVLGKYTLVEFAGGSYE